MNDKTPSHDDAGEAAVPESSSAQAAEPISDPSDTSPAGPATGASGGRGLAWLALLLALPGAAFVVFWFVQSPQPGADPAELEAAIVGQVDAALAQPLERLDRQASLAEEQAGQQQDLNDRLDRLEGQLAELSADLEDARQRLAETGSDAAGWQDGLQAMGEDFAQLADSLEARMATFAEQAGEQRELDRELARRLQLMEAAALLQMGQHRLELADDLAAARRAFRAADQVIQGLDEARLAPVRRQLLAELESLESHQPPDWMALSARLQRIGNQVNDWPLRAALAEAAGLESPITEAEAGRMDDLRRSLRQLVQVRPREGLPVDESRVQWVREQVRLRLATIEWGLARRDWSIVEGQMGPLTELVDEWFDPASPAVADFRAAMEELPGQARPVSPPALGAALSSLREQMDRS